MLGRPTEQRADGPLSPLHRASSRARRAVLTKPLLFVVLFERVDDVAEIAGDDGVELVEIQIDAVIGDAILRKIVGADAFVAVAGTDLAAARFGTFAMEFLLLHVEEPAAQNAQGPFVVLMLA